MADDPSALLRIAEAIADETPVDWGATSGDARCETLAALRLAESVAAAYRSVHRQASSEDGAGGSMTAVGTDEAVLFQWGHLRVLERLGDGSFGEVYRARDAVLDREVALKLRRAGAHEPRTSRRRFLHEARRLARVRHPNVVVVHGADVHRGRVGLWTDLVSGQTLEQRLANEGPLCAEEAALIGVDLCRALAAVHAAGVIHGDVKASNVMRERGGRIVLMDFGAGAEIDPTAAGRAQAECCGTPIVMAPELLQGEAPSPASDIYALGVLLYRLVTGRYPVEATTLGEMLDRYRRSETVPLRDARPDLPADFVAIVERALAVLPGRRYASAGTMEHALLAWLAPTAGPTMEARPEGRREPTGGPSPPGDPGSAIASAGRWWRQSRRRAWILAAASAVVAVGALLALAPHRDLGRLAPLHSLAVLPFQALDTEGADNYLGLGMADALINRLSRLPEIRVSPTSAVVRYAEARPDLHVVGEALGVDALVDGRIQRSGDRVRVTAQLVSTVEGKPIWAATFDQKSLNIFELEDSISEQLARALRLRLTEAEKATLTWRPTTNADAYQASVKGRYFLDRWAPAALEKSAGYFEQAIAADPTFAGAWVGLAEASSALPGMEPSPAPPDEAYGRARSAALRALELDGNLAQAHAVLGGIHLHHDWNWSAAESELHWATQLDPNCSIAYRLQAELLSLRGRHEDAIGAARRAIELDPLSLPASATLGQVLVAAGRVDDAIAELRKTLEIEPAFHRAYAILAAAYQSKGMHDEAAAQWQNAMALSGFTPEEVSSFGRAYASSGTAGAWRWRLGRLRDQAQRGYVPPTLLARAHTALGEPDEAFAWLERAFAAHDEFFLRADGEGAFAALRSDPRYLALRDRLALGNRVTGQEEAGDEPRPRGGLSLQAMLFRSRAGRVEPIATGGSVRPGDHLFLTVESPEPVHLYVLDEDVMGAAFVLFPLPDTEPANPLPAGRRHSLPGLRAGAAQEWVVTSAGGKEIVLVVGARRPLPELERAASALERAATNRAVERLATSASLHGSLRGVGGLAAPAPTPPPPGAGRLEALAAGLAPLVEKGDAWLEKFVLESSGP